MPHKRFVLAHPVAFSKKRPLQPRRERGFLFQVGNYRPARTACDNAFSDSSPASFSYTQNFPSSNVSKENLAFRKTSILVIRERPEVQSRRTERFQCGPLRRRDGRPDKEVFPYRNTPAALDAKPIDVFGIIF